MAGIIAFRNAFETRGWHSCLLSDCGYPPSSQYPLREEAPVRTLQLIGFLVFILLLIDCKSGADFVLEEENPPTEITEPQSTTKATTTTTPIHPIPSSTRRSILSPTLIPTGIVQPTLQKAEKAESVLELPDLELPDELTGGVEAVSHCTGESEEYLLKYGVPELNAELIQCIQEYMENN